MFADWELIGVPHRLVIGDRGLKEGTGISGSPRHRSYRLPLADIVGFIKAKLGQ